MQTSDYVDIMARANSCLEQQEQDYLFTMLDNLEKLYQIRRENRTEQIFWNQFWHEWDFPKLRDARKQAFDDMEDDKYFHHIKENRIVYRNFEKAVVIDHLRLRLYILILLHNDTTDINCEIFYNLQAYVQQFLEYNKQTYFITKRKEEQAIHTAPDTFYNIDSIQTENLEVTSHEDAIVQPVDEDIVGALVVSKKSRRKKKRLKQKNGKKDSQTKAEIVNRPKLCLQIKTPEGMIIELGNSTLTYIEFIKRIGYQKVQSLRIKYKDSSIFKRTSRAGYKEIKPGIYLNCSMKNNTKIEIINEICRRLGLSYQASLIEIHTGKK